MDNALFVDTLREYVGFRPKGGDLPPIDSGLTNPISGAYVNDINTGIITTEVMEAAATSFAPNYPQWSSTQAYTVGSRISYLGTIYVALQASTGAIPDSDPAIWEVSNELSDFLYQQRDGAILEVLNTIVAQKAEIGQARQLLAAQPLYQSAGNTNHPIVNQGLLVGIRFVLKEGDGLRMQITRLGLFLSGAASVPLYLWHSSRPGAPIAQTVINASTNSFEWQDPDEVMNLFYNSNDYDSGGYFFLGYFQDDLGTSRACSIQYSWDGARMCGSCNPSNKRYQTKRIPYVKAYGGYYVQSSLNGLSLPSADQFIFDKETFGINIQHIITCDPVSLMVSNPHIYSKVIQLQWAHRLINAVSYNARGNAIEERVKKDAQMIIKEDGYNTLGYKLHMAYKAVHEQLKDISGTCLPRTGKQGPVYTTAF